jgi:hypothetical protein
MLSRSLNNKILGFKPPIMGWNPRVNNLVLMSAVPSVYVRVRDPMQLGDCLGVRHAILR